MTSPGRFSIDSLASVHALLMDEEPASRDELLRILRYCGAVVTVAEVEVDALRTLALVRPDVLVVAVPRRHRGELTVVRRAQAAADPIPVLAILWPGDSLPGDAKGVVTLQRPIEAWDVCRMLAASVAVD